MKMGKMKKAQEELKSVVIVVVLIVVVIIIVRNYLQKPAGGVFDCTSMENATCQFQQCPPGYALLSYLKCGSPKGNACCQQLNSDESGGTAYVEQESR